MDVSKLLGVRKSSLDWICHALLQPTGDEAGDLQQTGPHPIPVVLLMVTGGPLTPGLGPPLHVRPQELNHTLENLCFLHLRVFKLL